MHGDGARFGESRNGSDEDEDAWSTNMACQMRQFVRLAFPRGGRCERYRFVVETVARRYLGISRVGSSQLRWGLLTPRLMSDRRRRTMCRTIQRAMACTPRLSFEVVTLIVNRRGFARSLCTLYETMEQCMQRVDMCGLQDAIPATPTAFDASRPSKSTRGSKSALLCNSVLHQSIRRRWDLREDDYATGRKNCDGWQCRVHGGLGVLLIFVSSSLHRQPLCWFAWMCLPLHILFIFPSHLQVGRIRVLCTSGPVHSLRFSCSDTEQALTDLS